MQAEVYVAETNRGILLSDSSNNVIGGTTGLARNVISGNETNGIEIFGSQQRYPGKLHRD